MKRPKAIDVLLAAPGLAMAGAGGLAGRLVGGFLAGVSAGRQVTFGGAYHEAARRDPATADWRARLASADQAILDDLDLMLARSRMTIANDPYAASAQGGYRRYVVGGGITARSAARDPDGKMLKTFNSALDGLWNEWFWEPRLCDAEGNKTLPEKQQLWMDELFAAGGLFLKEAYAPDAEGVGLLLQEIEYEQRDTLKLQEGENPVRSGVEIGPYGQAVAFHLHVREHPLEEYSTQSERVPASDCCHLYRQDRVRQRLGTPWMRSVLWHVRNLAMYQQYTLLQARTRAAFPGFIKQTTGGPGSLPPAVAKQLSAAGVPAAGGEADTELHFDIAPGLMPILKAGQEPFFPSPATPDTMYPPFVTEQLKGIAAGTGLDLGTVQRWYGDASFSGAKHVKLDLWAEIDWVQDLLFIQKVLRRVRRRFVELAIRERRIEAPRYWESPSWRAAYLTTNWQGPPRASDDQVKDESAWNMRFRGLRGTFQDYCNERGTDVRDVFAAWQEVLELAEEHGLREILTAFLLAGGENEAGAPKTDRQPNRAGPAVGDNGGGELAALLEAAAGAGRDLRAARAALARMRAEAED